VWFTRKQGERGAAAVEMAIVMPVLVFLVFGIIDLSRILNGELQLSQAAREGVRLASLSPAYSSAQAVQRAKDAIPAPAFGSGTNVTAAVTQACPASPSVTDLAIVKVSFDMKGILYPMTERTFSQTATMRCAG
jgi:Flp pilus assembly protein TadG